MTKLNKLLSATAILLGIVIVVLAIVLFMTMPKNEPNNRGSNLNDDKAKVGVIVIDNSGYKHEFSMEFKDNENGFELLKRIKAQDSTFQFDYTESEYGIYVDAFYGYKPDTSKFFWEFMLNGQSSMVGVKDYMTKAGDQLEFKLTEIK